MEIYRSLSDGAKHIVSLNSLEQLTDTSGQRFSLWIGVVSHGEGLAER